jgi:hypothetical protein
MGKRKSALINTNKKGKTQIGAIDWPPLRPLESWLRSAGKTIRASIHLRGLPCLYEPMAL